MKPTKVIVAKRQSAPARCPRDMGMYNGVPVYCGEELRLAITQNPISYLDCTHLVVMRCGAGHIVDGRSVLA